MNLHRGSTKGLGSEDSETRVKQRDGKLYVEGQQYGYAQGMIRTLRLYVSDLCYVRRLVQYDEGDVTDTYTLEGTAHLDRDALSIITNEDECTDELGITLRPWPKLDASMGDEPAAKLPIGLDELPAMKLGPWRGDLGYVGYDPEIGTPSSWFAEVYFPPPILDELVIVCRRGALGTLSLGFATDLWVSELDKYLPPSRSVTWYLAPGEHDDLPKLAWLAVTECSWTEKPLSLSAPPGHRSRVEVLQAPETEADTDAHANNVEARHRDERELTTRLATAQLTVANSTRNALYLVGAMLALVALILAFK